MSWVSELFDSFDIPEQDRPKIIEAWVDMVNAGMRIDLYDLLMGVERLKWITPEESQIDCSECESND